MKYELICELRKDYKLATMCRAFKVSYSGYFRWQKNKGFSKANEYQTIAKIMIELEENNFWELGGEGLQEGLAKQGIYIGIGKVYRIKRAHGIYPKTIKRKKHNKKSYKDTEISENILNQEFEVKEINKVWCSDIKYVWTDEGWDYLAVVEDLCSRRIVGFAQDKSMTAELTKTALNNAIMRRNIEKGLICHNDRGTQYTSIRYQRLLKQNGIISSMSRPGTPYDNACVESFFATLEKNFLQFQRFKTREEARDKIWGYIEGFYNSRRMHSSLGWISPCEFEMNIENEKMEKCC